MTCTAHPWGDGEGLLCIRTDEHATGHVYDAGDPPDRHFESSGE